MAREFIDHREQLEKPVTQGGFDRAMALALTGCLFGLTADQVIRECIDAGWWSINVEWVHARRMRSAVTQQLVSPNSKTVSLAEQLTDRSWADNKNKKSNGGSHD